MKRKTKEVYFKGTGRIYTLDAYEKKQDHTSKIAYSKDHQYVLEYSNSDVSQYFEMVTHIDYEKGKLSEEDLAFENYLYELCPEYYESYAMMVFQRNKQMTSGQFQADSVELECYFDSTNAAEPTGAEYTFLIGVSVKKDSVITLAKVVIDLDVSKGDESHE